MIYIYNTKLNYIYQHVKIYRVDRDIRGFKIFVTITIPHLKGRGHYFSEAQRTFQKTLVSEVIENNIYDPEIDIVLYICALAFRRNVTVYQNFNAWYVQTNHATVQFQEDAANLPVFIRSSM